MLISNFFLIDDHPSMRLGIRLLLEANNFNVIGEAGNLNDAKVELSKLI